MIIVDSKEYSSAPEITKSVSNVVETAIDKLEVGDYLILGESERVLVERKTITDFLGSLKGRLWGQLKLMKLCENEFQPILLVEGYYGLIRKFGWNEGSIYMQVEAIQTKWKIPVVHTLDKRGTITYLATKARQVGKPKSPKVYALRPSASKKLSLREQALYIVEGFPQISAVRAEQVLKHFGSIRNFVINAERIDEVPGIGKKIKEEILNVVDYRFG